MSKGPKATTKVAQIGGPAADFGGTERDGIADRDRKPSAKSAALHAVGMKRAGRTEIKDYSNPVGKLTSQSAGARRMGDNRVGVNGSEGGPKSGDEATGQDNARSWQQR